ncbi:MAG: extracellular solute-binding protein [Treponema sp.]|jgi:putative aldouronate transport system substrate-binding protein|nr:extracellular solute-binding protein [Treponema sp.]
MKNKITAGFLILLAALVLFSGCSPKTQAGSAAPDVLSLTVDRPIFTESPVGKLVETEWRKALDKYMGMPVNLTINEVPYGDYSERLSIYMASGEWADIFSWNGGDISSLFDLGEQGLLLNLRDYPDQTKNFFSLTPDTALKTITSEDNGVYMFHDLLISSYNGSQECVRVNVDVLNRHNLKVPETLDDLYQLAKQLKALYPDTFPITGYAGMLQNNIMRAFHGGRKLYYNGSKFVYGNRENAFRQGLEYLHKLYAEKLLDPEWYTDNETQRTAKLNTGKSFIAYSYSDMDPESHPGVTLGYIPYLSPDGSTVPWYPNDNQRGVILAGGYCILINAKTKYPELAMKIVDFQYSKEMLTLFNWGVEGTTYTVQADGSKQFVPEIMNAPNMSLKMAEYGINTSYSVRSGIQFVPQDRDVAVATMPNVPVYLNGSFNQIMSCWKYYDDLEKAGKAIQAPVAPSVSFTSAERDQISTIRTIIDTFADEYEMKFITGEVSLSQWDRYLSEFKALADIDVVLNIYNSKL